MAKEKKFVALSEKRRREVFDAAREGRVSPQLADSLLTAIMLANIVEPKRDGWASEILPKMFEDRRSLRRWARQWDEIDEIREMVEGIRERLLRLAWPRIVAKEPEPTEEENANFLRRIAVSRQEQGREKYNRLNLINGLLRSDRIKIQQAAASDYAHARDILEIFD